MGKHSRPRRRLPVAAGVATAAGAAVLTTTAAMPASAADQPTVTVAPGNTLSGIAAKVCGSALRWPSLFAANRGAIGSNPNMILPGQVLRAACAAVARAITPASHAAHEAHLAHLARLAALQAASVQQAPAAQVTGVSGGTGPISIAGMSAFEQCVITRESGGDATAQNPISTASGLFQFLDTTWAGYGGYLHAKDAPVSVQEAKFNQIMSQPGGAGNWQPYDGCTP